jgi:acyl carrier protein
MGKRMMPKEIESAVRSLLSDVLGLTAAQLSALSDESELFGAIPELDSMAVAGLLTELEDRLDISIDDDEVDGELFATFGNLVRFVQYKVAA